MEKRQTEMRNEIEAFCGNVRRLRAENGLSKEEMAEVMDVDNKTLNELEEGRLPHTLGVEVLVHLSQHFSLTVDQLFGLESPIGE